MKQFFTLLFSLTMLYLTADAQKITYDDNRSEAGYTLTSQGMDGVSLLYSVKEFSLPDIDIRGETMKKVVLPGNILPNDEGAPDLPGTSRFIAVPEGAEVVLDILDIRRERYHNVEIAPAPRIPLDTETGPLEYNKDQSIYSADAFYPAEPVKISGRMQIRGVDMVILGITPFQYNPVTKELLVLRDIEAAIRFTGGNGEFGEERLRSRWWDPILRETLLNHGSLPEMDYSGIPNSTRTEGCEYLIIVPDNPVFISWADTIRRFRTMQGITTMIKTTADIGANTVEAIENYVNDIYASWNPVPAAILLMADYGSGASGLMSPVWDDYCVSDHIFADVDGDDIEEFAFARMTAQNEEHLEVMVRKALDYETNPPTDPDFYDHPITALGYQTDRWFQVCSESLAGYFENVQGKNPVRINAINTGNPLTGPWTTTDEAMIVGVFGPDGYGYIPSTPAEVSCSWYGTSTEVTNALNAGGFILQHRDHGYEYGWGEPDYDNSDIDDLTNTDLTFVFSVNCLTGKYNMMGECFTEKFHRHTYNGEPAGALGLIAASEVSYSFVNDTYVWGMLDYLWPDFLPDYGSMPESEGMFPAFANTAGKYFLMMSNWPYNVNNKEVTYNLFHHHGDAFTRLYSEVPLPLTVMHDDVVLAGLDYFTVTADEGSLIAVSSDGNLMGTAVGTGGPVNVMIDPLYPPATADIVVTKQNHFRYHQQIQVIPPDGAYIVYQASNVNDVGGNNNGILDYAETVMLSLTLKNVGSEDAQNVSATITSTDEYVTITNNTANFGDIPSSQTVTVTDQLEFSVTGAVPNGHDITFDIEMTDGDSTWNSISTVRAHSPVLAWQSFTVSDPSGNNNGRLDPGETAQFTISVRNIGGSDAYDVTGSLHSEDPYLTIESSTAAYGTVAQNETSEQSFTVSASIVTPPGHLAGLGIDFNGLHGIAAEGAFESTIGQHPMLILDLDRNANSGPAMVTALDQLGVTATYSDEFISDYNGYHAIFVSLGTYALNYVLTVDEGDQLKAYLESGGNLYMEGGDTWFFDQNYNNPTNLHPMFNINGISDGNSDLYLVKGTEGTFLEGMNYVFMGDNNYIDVIEPVAPAYSTFYNNSPRYDCVIANDQGSYKTLGSNFEFGGLNDNTLNDKKKLMQKYLEFFGLNTVTMAPAIPEGPATLCGGGSSEEYATSSVPEADHYIWTVAPREAGTVEGYGTQVTVQWNDSFSGTAHLCVCGMNEIGVGPVSDSLEILIAPLPTASYSLTSYNICEGDSAGLVMEVTGESPWQVILNLNGGSYQFDFNKPAVPTIWLDPITDLSIYVESITDGNGCTNTGFETILLEVDKVPAKHVVEGPSQVDILAGNTTVYTAGGASGPATFEWTLNPSTAGTMTPAGESVEITWAGGYTGNATLEVTGTNDCGTGPASDVKSITVYSSLGIATESNFRGISLYPNPGDGKVTLEIRVDELTHWKVTVVNATGVKVWEKERISVKGIHHESIDLSQQAEGPYLMILDNGETIFRRKIIIQ